MRLPAVVVLVLTVNASLPCASLAQDPAAFYEEHCAACHSIGGGALGGPDLAGVTARRDRDWLIRFLLDPQAFEDDPVVRQMIDEAGGMEMDATEGLTPDLAEEILSLIEQRSGTTTAPPVERPATAVDVQLGRALFTGSRTLSASGTACVACHPAGGVDPPAAGRLGPDLAQVSARLGGPRGVTSWLGSPPTPMMRALYRPRPLTADETHALAAFLAGPSTVSTASATVPRFVVPGAAVGLAFLALIGVIWSRRFRAVRQPLVARMRAHTPSTSRHAPGAGGHP